MRRLAAIVAAAGLVAMIGVGATLGRAAPVPTSPQTTATASGLATFAGGCFWCEEEAFEEVPGVTSVVSGYTGGTKVDPTYEEVSAGGTGHAEAVEVHFDPAKVTYEQLLTTFWHNTDLLDAGGQFCDRGDQYRSEIFYRNDQQKQLAEKSLAELRKSGRFGQPIATKIAKAGPFYKAEDYHQDYYKKNPIRYKYYRWGCGRDQRLQALWGPAAQAHASNP